MARSNPPEAVPPPTSGAPTIAATASLEATLPADVLPSRDSEPLPPVPREHYVVKGELARGGMGRILEARDVRLDRPVAIKELLSSEASLRARFEREARITARLQHPAIVGVYEAGTWPGGAPFFAMKKVSGRPLGDAIAAAQALPGRLALLPHLVDVANAIAYAHDRGVIHRDIKPGNVLIGDYGETVVIDWGLAKDRRGREEPRGDATPTPRGARGDETIAGDVFGTPAYMAPEQARGEPVDERADVYALGAMLYHVLAGAPPYEGASVADLLAQVKTGPPPDLRARQRGVAPELLAIVEKAMAREAAARYPSARELADDLRRFQTGQIVGSHRYTPWQLVRRWVRRHAAAAAALATALLVGAVTITQIVRESRRARRDERAAEATAVKLEVRQAKDDVVDARYQLHDEYTLAHRLRRTPQAELDEARLLFGAACEAHYQPGCMGLGRLYDGGEGVARDYARARVLYRQACDAGDMKGCDALGRLYADGYGVRQDNGMAEALFRRACRGGVVSACANVGVLYQVVEKTPAKAAPWYREACDAGSAEGCAGLGDLYASGEGVGRDYGKALALEAKACASDSPAACGAAGALYRDGHGGPRDYGKAAALLLEACDGRVAQGCADLGRLYRDGRGVAKDPAKAVELFARACRLGGSDLDCKSAVPASAPAPALTPAPGRE